MPRFLIEAVKRRGEVGAVAASGRYLAREMTSSIGVNGHADRVLEVGAGTGAFTGRILDRLSADGQADIVELNPRFCEQLKRRIVDPWSHRQTDRSARVIEGSIEEADLTGDYTTIVCGLPFNSFPPVVASRIFAQLKGLLSVDGTLAYFEYAALPSIRCMVPGPWRSGARMHRESITRLSEGMRTRRQLVLRNILPAWAVKLQAHSA
ncbi:MAG: hypothetical protein MK077_05435 [Phycisphaerales bacterium]|nr:hypothetical protein [Phycisphaerales bacterium]